MTQVEEKKQDDPLGIFGKYLSLWVLICMIIGTSIGATRPVVADALAKAAVADVNIIVGILVWIMIFPMALGINFRALLDVKRYWKGAAITTFTNWAIQPFSMYAISYLFLRLAYRSVISTETAKSYLAGNVLLGGSPCTAMVFVWSHLANGDPAFTLVQVAINDAIIFALYVPTLYLLLDLTEIYIPYVTIVVSVVIFVAIPFGVASIVRFLVFRAHASKEEAESSLKRFSDAIAPVGVIALLATIVLTFIFQGQRLVDNWVDVLLIAVPQIIQTFLIAGLAFGACYWAGLPFNVAAPSCYIAASNFFELAIAIALSAYGLQSGATLATVVGVLVEVPVMLGLVKMTLACKHFFPEQQQKAAELPTATVGVQQVELPVTATPTPTAAAATLSGQTIRVEIEK